MSIGKKLLALVKMRATGLLTIAVIASALLILTNYASLKITSAVRAYINGESQYSKGQKDATRNLIMYLNTGDSLYWADFRRELQVPIGDSIARAELMREGDDDIVRKGFLQGRNKKEDLNELIWLFKNFKDVYFMNEAIMIWKEADMIIGLVAGIGDDVHRQLLQKTLTEEEKDYFIKQINLRTAQLTKLERAFSESLGAGARRIDTYLFYLNLLMTLLIIGTMIGYIIKTVRQLKERNADLVVINKELDKFLYSASHDLRAPISSMKGLINVISAEKDHAEIKRYLALMNVTLDKQDGFIREIIDFSRNKKTQIDNIPVSLKKMINETVLQHQYMPGANTISIEEEIGLDVIQSDPLRLEIVLNNIISNAIKYSDISKDRKYIFIKTFKSGQQAVIKVEDNGIGIDKNYLSRIFDMFFVTDHEKNGSGLGLYITKETIAKLKGAIQVDSEKGHGTTFTVRIPIAS